MIAKIPNKNWSNKQKSTHRFITRHNKIIEDTELKKKEAIRRFDAEINAAKILINRAQKDCQHRGNGIFIYSPCSVCGWIDDA